MDFHLYEFEADQAISRQEGRDTETDGEDVGEAVSHVPLSPSEFGAAMSEFLSDLPIQLNQTLIESTKRMKAERDQLRTRIERMDQHHDQVSDLVYRKVRADYIERYKELNRYYQDKKGSVDAELEKISDVVRELSTVLETHRATLEEAKFRHFLGEFSDQKYKSVEDVEEREIAKHTHIIDKLNGYIGQYEALFASERAAALEARARRATAEQKHVPLKRVNEDDDESTYLASEEVSSSALGREPVLQVKNAPKEPVFDASENTPTVTQTASDIIKPNLSAHSESSHSESSAPSTQTVSATASVKVEQGDLIPELSRSVSALQTPQSSIEDILKSIPLEQEGVHQEKSVSAISVSDDTPSDSFAEAFEARPLPKATLSLIDTGGEMIHFSEVMVDSLRVIGRLPGNDIVLPSSKVSRRHAEISVRDGEYVIVDLESSNGVYVNNNRVKESLLRNGDVIGIGRYQFRFTLAE